VVKRMTKTGFARTVSREGIMECTRAGLELAEARQRVAVADYEATIQSAFRDVADALAATDVPLTGLVAELRSPP